MAGLDADHAVLPQQGIEIVDDAGNRERRLRLGDDLREHREEHRRFRQRDQILGDADRGWREPRDIVVVCCAHAQGDGPGVHPTDERRQAALIPDGQHRGEVTRRGQQQALQQLILAELLAGNHRQDRFVLISLVDVGSHIGAADGQNRPSFADGQRMVFEDEEGGHHLRGARHRDRRQSTGGLNLPESIDREGRLSVRGPGKQRRSAESLGPREDGCRSGPRERPEVLKAGDKDQQQEQIWKRPPKQPANASRSAAPTLA